MLEAIARGYIASAPPRTPTAEARRRGVAAHRQMAAEVAPLLEEVRAYASRRLVLAERLRALREALDGG